ncbi:MAG: tyrosine-type recombinase/integrase [Candidatus Hydrothermarchaeaceae archaeon]
MASYSDLTRDKRLGTWIKSFNSKSTTETYLSGWNKYLEYHSEANGGPTTPTQLLNVAIKDKKKPIENRGAIEEDINGFVQWALKKQIAPGSVRQYITALRSFYDFYGYPLIRKKLKIPKNVKKATVKPENIKIEYRPKQVKKLLDVTKSLRDKAVELGIFQSGMDASTIASLNYSHIKEELEAGTMPLMVKLVRPKEGILYRTFLGNDAVGAIKLYLNERKSRGDKIDYNTPLFTSEGTHINKQKRMTTKNFQDNLRNYTIKAGLISKERLEAADFNPARPHALRAGFSTILKLNGVNQDVVDGFLGHTDRYKDAYTLATDDELRKIYSSIEEALSVVGVSSGISEIEGKLKKEIEKQNLFIRGLTGRVQTLETTLTEISENYSDLFEWIAESGTFEDWKKHAREFTQKNRRFN